MKNKIINILIIIAILFYPIKKVFADTIPSDRLLPRFVDNANLLDEDDEKNLNVKLDEISQRQGLDVVIVTIDSLGGKTPTEYADDFYDYNDYGMGENDDGILFLISIEDRDWAISTHAEGIRTFTDAGQKHIMKKVKPYLKDNDFKDGFDEFASLCDDFITKAKTGDPYDSHNLSKKNKNSKSMLIFLMPINILVGFLLSTLIMKQQKNNVLSVSKHSNFTNDYSNNIVQTGRYDRLISKNIFKTQISDTGKSGSSTHTSSSGRTHGGSSGKF